MNSVNSFCKYFIITIFCNIGYESLVGVLYFPQKCLVAKIESEALTFDMTIESSFSGSTF